MVLVRLITNEDALDTVNLKPRELELFESRQGLLGADPHGAGALHGQELDCGLTQVRRVATSEPAR